MPSLNPCCQRPLALSNQKFQKVPRPHVATEIIKNLSLGRKSYIKQHLYPVEEEWFLVFELFSQNLLHLFKKSVTQMQFHSLARWSFFFFFSFHTCRRQYDPPTPPPAHLTDAFRKLEPDWLQTFVAIKIQQNVVKGEERALTMNSFPLMANFFLLYLSKKVARWHLLRECLIAAFGRLKQ